MLFPITEGYEKMRKEQDRKVEEDGVEGVEDILYFKQTSTELLSLFTLSALKGLLIEPVLPVQSATLVEHLRCYIL